MLLRRPHKGVVVRRTILVGLLERRGLLQVDAARGVRLAQQVGEALPGEGLRRLQPEREAPLAQTSVRDTVHVVALFVAPLLGRAARRLLRVGPGLAGAGGGVAGRGGRGFLVRRGPRRAELGEDREFLLVPEGGLYFEGRVLTVHPGGRLGCGCERRGALCARQSGKA